MSLHQLPHVNALLNTCCALLLVLGYVFIRRRRPATHRACMIAALATSVLFLASYLTYHYRVGSVRFTHAGWIRPFYFTILVSHTVLAAAIVPLALVTVRRAWRRDLAAHVAIARWTLPVWLYVSVTGVAVYWMLYRL